MNIELNVGNLWTTEFLNYIIDANKRYAPSTAVTSLYGSIPKYTASARSADRLPDRDDEFLEDYIQRARENNIHIRWTLNQSCLGSSNEFYDHWYKHMRPIVLKLTSMGVDQWTIASPLIMELMRDLLPEALLEVSTIAEVNSVLELDRWVSIGANGVNLSIMANRDFKLLENIADFCYSKNIDITLLANEFCLYKCPWRTECYNLSSHNSQRSGELFDYYPFSRCNNVRLRNPVEWVRARFILPQWMGEYSCCVGINKFKITGRTASFSAVQPIIEAYMKQEYKGNLLGLWPTISPLGNTAEPADSIYIDVETFDKYRFLEHFMIDYLSCSVQDCSGCRICETFTRRATGR